MKAILIFEILFNFSIFAGWSEIITTGSVPQLKNSSAVYIPSQNRMLVFAGRTPSGISNELWSLNLTNNNWTQVIAVNSPPLARYTQNAYYDSLQNRMIIWSGQGVELYNDVWAYNIATNMWQLLWPDGNSPGVPLKRYGTGSIFDPVTGNIITFAGFTTSGRFEDTWSFQADSMRWTERIISHPPKRCLHSACFAYDLRKMIIYGGQDTGPLDDIWSFDLSNINWQNITPVIKPPGRFFYSMIYTGNGNIAVFGGLNANPLGDMWKFSLNTNLWEQIDQGSMVPQPRWGHTAIYIPGSDKMVIFGGEGTAGFNDTWQYTNVSIIGITHNQAQVPDNFLLEQNFPNPFNPVTKIEFQIKDLSTVKLTVYDITGREVSTLVNNTLKPGLYNIEFDGSNFAGGVYIYVLNAGGYKAVKRMMLLK
jgi:hypothetical protein